MKKSKRTCIWLPSPLGDAILATPALRAIRNQFPDRQITFISDKTVKAFLTPSCFCDDWLVTQWDNPMQTAKAFKALRPRCSSIVLLKNSFSCALAAFLAGIPERIGYARDGRSALLTEKLRPKRDRRGKFKPMSMIDYYLTVAGWLGCDVSDRAMELEYEQQDLDNVAAKLPTAMTPKFPLIILVPGGAFGPSKLWPSDRWAKVADKLIEKYRATVLISIAPNPAEIEIADAICEKAKHKLLSLHDTPFSPSELKALFGQADLVVTNDTGPRHIAIALKRKLITLFGPNNYNWTETGYPDEIKVTANVKCAPCDKPQCKEDDHYCMKGIKVSDVMKAVEQHLGDNWGLV